VAYIPNPEEPRIVGLSKLNRLVDLFARRLQVQERLTTDIANALEECLKPAGVGVYIKARHMCMESRGVQQQGHYTVTSKLTGVMRDQASTRSEFMLLTKD
jgi:GTP cyclohydrolase I